MPKIYKRNCNYCGKHYKGQGVICCSRQCSDKWNGLQQRKKIEVMCNICKIIFETHPYRIKQGTGKYCSQKCFGISLRKETSVWQKHWYKHLHYWVTKNLGRPNQCEHCKNIITKPKLIHWANKSGEYKKNLDDWIRLCYLCHVKYDK